MEKDNDDYYTSVFVSGDTVTVSDTQGGIDKTSRVEIAIPESYKGTFSMQLASGEVYAETDLKDYEDIPLDLENGQMNMQKLAINEYFVLAAMDDKEAIKQAGHGLDIIQL